MQYICVFLLINLMQNYVVLQSFISAVFLVEARMLEISAL